MSRQNENEDKDVKKQQAEKRFQNILMLVSKTSQNPNWDMIIKLIKGAQADGLDLKANLNRKAENKKSIITIAEEYGETDVIQQLEKMAGTKQSAPLEKSTRQSHKPITPAIEKLKHTSRAKQNKENISENIKSSKWHKGSTPDTPRKESTPKPGRHKGP